MKMLVEIELFADWEHETDEEAVDTLNAVLESGAESCCASIKTNVLKVYER